MYRLSAYYVARVASDLPLDCLLPSLFTWILYWMAGLRLSAGGVLGRTGLGRAGGVGGARRQAGDCCRLAVRCPVIGKVPYGRSNFRLSCSAAVALGRGPAASTVLYFDC